MIRNLDKNELEHLLHMLDVWDAFEMNILPGKDREQEVLIPFLMNDAAEVYIRLSGCKVMGEWKNTYDGAATLTVIEDGPKKALIIRLPDGSVTTIWYQKAKEHFQCYQYHRIGHQWRKKRGEDQLRRLVNLICVIHDKYTFLGADGINEGEGEIFALAEFAPLIYWTPINDSILGWYPQTLDGICAMRNLAKQAGDEKYLRLLDKYEKTALKDKVSEKQIESLAKKLTEKEHEKLCDYIYKMICACSKAWEVRTYDEAEMLRQKMAREKAEEAWRKKGYQGEYPLLERYNTRDKVFEQVYLAEEQPFTVLESEDYAYKIVPIESRSRVSGQIGV